MRQILNLLALLAVLVMPFGMSAAPAAPQQQHRAASMPMQHCPDQAPSQHGKPGFVQCTMACAAALPAIDSPRVERVMIVCGPEISSSVRLLSGLHPETDTPPPRRS